MKLDRRGKFNKVTHLLSSQLGTGQRPGGSRLRLERPTDEGANDGTDPWKAECHARATMLKGPDLFSGDFGRHLENDTLSCRATFQHLGCGSDTASSFYCRHHCRCRQRHRLRLRGTRAWARPSRSRPSQPRQRTLPPPAPAPGPTKGMKQPLVRDDLDPPPQRASRPGCGMPSPEKVRRPGAASWGMRRAAFAAAAAARAALDASVGCASARSALCMHAALLRARAGTPGPGRGEARSDRARKPPLTYGRRGLA